jgi:diguanylate cyclase (GGDEF)-like protein
MKVEKEPRINAGYGSIKEYFSLFFVLAAFNGFHMWIYVEFSNRGIFEANIQFGIAILVSYIMIITMLVMVIIGVFRYTSWSKPTRKLGEAARKIARGDFSVRIAPLRKDGKKDFSELMFDDFNSMADELENNISRINELKRELLAANEKLEALSITDELTKLNNRRSFLDYMDIVWKQNYRLQLPMAVLMIDIDYFKKYNDSLGHLEGDKALIAVAQCLKNQLKRATDYIARFGGEEFICLLPYFEEASAVNFAHNMVQSVEDLKIPHPVSETSKYVTISAGMAIFVPQERNSGTQLLDEADKALYMAKQSGRNRVVITHNKVVIK